MAEPGEPEIFTSDRRAEESAYLQWRPAKEKSPGELDRAEAATEYARMLGALPEHIREATKKMKEMRALGMPDKAAYAKVRDEMTGEYNRFKAISQRMADFEGELEEAYNLAAQTDAPVVENEQVHEAEGKAEDEEDRRMEAEVSAKTHLELYDDEVRKLLLLAVELEDNVASFARQKMLEKLRPTIIEEQQQIRDKLNALDKDNKGRYHASMERGSLLDVLRNIDRLLGELPPMRPMPRGPIPVASPAGEPHAVLAAVEGEDESFITSLEIYDEEVRKLLMRALELEENIEFYEKQQMVDKSRGSIRDSIDSILQRLKELDAARTDSRPSRERDSLIDILGKIDERMEKVPKGTATASPLSESRAAYRAVKAQYAAVQHTLSEDQRRAMRLTIASMNEAVRQAEDEAWKGMFARQFEPIPPPEPPVQSLIQLAVAHATEHAPALATAALASLPKAVATPPRRGIFGALHNAFKLR